MGSNPSPQENNSYASWPSPLTQNPTPTPSSAPSMKLPLFTALKRSVSRLLRARAHDKGNPSAMRGGGDLRGGDRSHPITVKGRAPFSRQRRKKTPVGQDKYCPICMEDKYDYECFGLLGCSHVYCARCISQYVTTKVEENVVSIGCPDPACEDGFLELEMCRSILPTEVFDRWGNALCESTITGSKRFYCPHNDCSALLIYEEADHGNEITNSKCPHCFRWFCVRCRVPWHVGITCEVYQKMGADERTPEDLMLMEVARHHQWKRCPKCKFYVEKTFGCTLVKCRCGVRFCYGCATEMKMDHYCPKCRR